jgi:hypothetical protein
METLKDRSEPRPYLLRDLPPALMDKMRAAAAIHKRPLKVYVRELFEEHVRALEKQGLTLSRPKGK